MKIVFATENPGKLREVRQFANEYGVEILSPSQAGLKPESTEETGTSYQENAGLKVKTYLSQTAAKNFIICGDDTGIGIDALDGEPGLHTRRWLGHEMSDDEIVGYTLGRLHTVTEPKRTARFVSVVAYSVHGGPMQYETGELDGRIAVNTLPEVPKQSGFPFRQLFIVTGKTETPLWKFDTLESSKREGLLSHREAAFAKVFGVLKKPQ